MNRRDFLQIGATVAVAAPVIAACGRTGSDPTTNTRTPTSLPGEALSASSSAPVTATTTTADAGRVLLAYFSRPGENYYYGDRIDLTVGNTQVVAEMIAAAITVDTFQIQAADPYPQDYEQTVARNVQEERDDARPAIADALPDIAGYDTVLLGSPVWNSQAPMIMRTILDGVDLTGRVIHPFVTFAVSGMGRVRRDYADLLAGSTVTDGLAVQGEQAADAGPQIDAWLRELNLLAG